MSVTKKRVSKKNKSAWRKYVNIKDVEDFLEEQRQEERIGSVSEKKDEELFTVDTIANNKLLTTKQKRKRNAFKPPKNLLALQNTSKVQDPRVQRDHVKLKKNGRDLVAEVLNPKKSRKVLQSMEDRAKYYEKLDKIKSRDKTGKLFKDAWAEDDDLDRKQFLNNEWINRNMGLHNLKSIGKPLVKVHASMHHKTSLAKSFELPHPGISYNPSLKDHQALMQKVIEKEEQIIKEEKHLNRVTSEMFSKVTDDERKSAWAVEMSHNLSPEDDSVEKQPDNEEDANESESGAVYDTINPPVQIKKKAQKAKRKLKEQREILQQIKQKKEQKKQITDIHRLKHLTAEILEEKAAVEEARQRRIALIKKKKYEPKRISKNKFEEPDIDVALAEDIAGNLRNVKPQSSLLIDRFKNFQKRNLLPANVDLGPRKRRKIKRFVRGSHKETPQQKQKGEVGAVMEDDLLC